MKEKQDDLTSSSNQPLPGFGVSPFERPQTSDLTRDLATDTLSEPLTEELEDEQVDFDDSDRDTDFGLGFREETIDEEEAFDTLLPEDLVEDDAEAFDEQEAFLQQEVQAVAAAEVAALKEMEQGWENEPVPEVNDDKWDQEPEAPNWDRPAWADSTPTDTKPANEPTSTLWHPEDDYMDDDGQGQWPVSLILIGAVALLLVVAGVYGVMQQRSATQDEIRELRASLATAASPEEMANNRAALENVRDHNAQLEASIITLRAENQRLIDTVAGLEAQVAAGEVAPSTTVKATPITPAAPVAAVKAPEPAPAAKPKATPARDPSPATAATAATPGQWFVNFGSYGQRGPAEDWARRLRPLSGQVIVAPSSRDGRTFYRVRIINIPSKSAAQGVAGNLESTYGVSKLWVGQQ